MQDSSSNMTRVYRFKFTDGVTRSIYEFAKLHQFDDRATYKEAWKDWLDTHEDEVRCECRRLTELGYDGNIENKMYKSGRYYFRTKSSDEVEPKERRTYVPTSSDLIESMNAHIKMHYNSPEYTPALGYDDFCRSYKHELAQEIAYLGRQGITESREISAKIKKTYKNRYFQFIQHK